MYLPSRPAIMARRNVRVTIIDVNKLITTPMPSVSANPRTIYVVNA